MLLPGKAAAEFRTTCADVVVRYMGGSPTLVAEIAANRLAQESLPEEHPMRIFGETVGSEALTRKREELQLVELDARVKRARVRGVCEVVSMGMQALKDLGLPIDDRDRMRAKDVINQATLEAPKDYLVLLGLTLSKAPPTARLLYIAIVGEDGGGFQEKASRFPIFRGTCTVHYKT